MDRSFWGAVAGALVGAVFLFSAVTKLANPRQWRSQAGELGVSEPIARTVPYVEIVLGALLVAQVQRDIVAWLAVALLVVFTALLALRLAQGRRPPCACFGSLSSKPIGVGHLVRNGVLIALAVLAAVL